MWTPERLKEMRKRLGMDQVALAEALGVSLHCVHAYEQGRNPVPKWIVKLLNILETNPEILLHQATKGA